MRVERREEGRDQFCAGIALNRAGKLLGLLVNLTSMTDVVQPTSFLRLTQPPLQHFASPGHGAHEHQGEAGRHGDRHFDFDR